MDCILLDSKLLLYAICQHCPYLYQMQKPHYLNNT
nr:MAG TPA: protein of unknown function (DUF5522) [Caudoviricetes sp.]